VRTFVHDISGVKRVTLHYHSGTHKKKIEMRSCGAYPSRTNPAIIATEYKTVLPAGMGDIRHFVEAVDGRGNVSYSPVGRIFIG